MASPRKRKRVMTGPSIDRAVDKALETMIDIHRVEARVDTHEKVCTERYGNIATTMNNMNDRLNSISNRMFAQMVGVLAIMVAAFGALAFYVMTGGHH
jgi:hypothetical protein